MKKRYENRLKRLNIVDIKLIKWAVFFFALWLLGFLAYWIEPIKIISFLIKWKWLFFALMLIVIVRPVQKLWFKK